MRTTVLLASLALLLAGCSGGEGDDPPAAAPPPSGSISSTAAPPPVPTTDTLHLLLGPAMTTVPPTGSDERTPVGFGDGGPDGNQAGAAVWAHQVTRAGNVTAAEVHVWVDVKEQMVDFPGTPLREACTWRLETRIGQDQEPIVGCINEPAGVVAVGVKELVFNLVLQGPIELEANETVSLALSRSAFSPSPNNAVDALSGSAEHDSRAILRGLQEPVRAA